MKIKYIAIPLLIILGISVLQIVSYDNTNYDLNFMPYTYLGAVDADTKNSRYLNISGLIKYVEKPDYSSSPSYRTSTNLETEKNIIKRKDGNYFKFITKYFLPDTWKGGGQTGYDEYWYNCQAIAVDGNYLYVLSSSGYDKNLGFIVKYDMEILDKYINKSSNPSSMDRLRELGNLIHNGENLNSNDKKIKKAIKVGEKFKTGHGQSLAFNPKTKSLWIWKDTNHDSINLTLEEINMETLKPDKTYQFNVRVDGKYLKQFYNLGFDNEGNFYTDQPESVSSNSEISIYKGTINKNHIDFKQLTTINQKPGTYIQSIAIDKKNNNLYLVSDKIFYILPLKKLNEGTITEKDLNYSLFNTNREFEGLDFDKNGYAYLLILRGPEILFSSGK